MIQSALCELISQDEKNIYLSLYASSLQEKIAASVLQASNNNVCAELKDIFAPYPLDFLKAQAKDTIYLIFAPLDDESLRRLEQSSNAAGGKIELCQSNEEIELEIIRARYRRALFDETSNAKKLLSKILAPHNQSAFDSRISTLYSSSDAELENVSAITSSFESECRKIFDLSKETLSSILHEAEAERFLLDHKYIATKPKDELELSDEIFLKYAISDFLSIDPAVQKELRGQITLIAEKYNMLTKKKILSLSPDDALFMDLCEDIFNELRNISPENIDVFYNNCNKIYKKAQSMKELLNYSRSIQIGQAYKDYNSAEKAEFQDICKQFAASVSKADTHADSLEERIQKLLENAKLLLNQCNECARVRIATRNSESIEIQSLLVKAREKIKSTTDRSEIVSIADQTIFKINRELTRTEIISRSDRYEHLINQMVFLSAEEKSTFSSKIKSLKASKSNDAAATENIASLEFMWNDFFEKIEAFLTEATEKDLLKAKENYIPLLEKEAEKLTSILNSLPYISSEKRDEIYNLCFSAIASHKAQINSSQASSSATEIYTKFLEFIYSLENISKDDNLKNYKLVLFSDLEKLKELKSNYSDENYNVLLSTINASKSDIELCTTSEDAKKLFGSALDRIKNINTLLDDAKATVLRSLEENFNFYLSRASLYSQENIDAIKEFYNNSIKKISGYESISDVALVNSALSDALLLMRSVRMDILFSCSEATAVENSTAQYPIEYDFGKGYWGRIYSKSGLLSSAVFKISDIYCDNNIQTLTRKAAKDNQIKTLGSIEEDILKKLKKCVVSLGVDMELSNISDGVSSYTVKLLLPSHLSAESILGVVFVDENGSVEFYRCNAEGTSISFELSHFSNYYIVSEGTTNLIPLIIFLSIVLFFELVVLIFVAIIHLRRRRKEIDMFPLLNAFGFNPFLTTSLLKVQPQNGVGIAIFLSVAAIALGCGVAMFAKLELNATKKSAKKKEAYQKNDAPVALLKEKRYALKEKQEIPVLCAVGATEELETLPSADEFYEVYEYEEHAEPQELSRHAANRAEINIDSIAEQFDAGELVNLELLKKKRLVSKRTDYVKILARGTLSKPLIIEANDFSRAAEEMLKAVGGEAIRVGTK